MKSRSLVLLSGEETGIPLAEAQALFLAYDPQSKFQFPEERVMIAESGANPEKVARRIAFARRVGMLVEDPSDAAEIVRGRKVRLRTHSLKGSRPGPEPYEMLDGLDVRVDLDNPDFEFSVVEGRNRYVALTVPQLMNQAWSVRRPRKRAFFHPSAIFPKLSRALVNLTRCTDGELFLDPFCGTGSIPIEAAEVGLRVLALDQAARMARGSLANMKLFRQAWLGVLRADAFSPPLTLVDGVATDVPYGRASSTKGRGTETVIRRTLDVIPSVMRRGARLVLMHPGQIAVATTRELSIEDEHHLYIHKRLTRAITVLRRN